MFRTLVIAATVMLTTVSTAQAGKYNPVLSVGDSAPAWKDLPGTDGQRHSLAGLKDAAVVVLIFTCNSCPYAVAYEERIIALTKEFAARKVAVVAVNVNKIPDDNFEAMQQRAKSQGFNFTYLFDETQQIANDYGATYTPEFFVLDRQRKIAYMGALDDSPDPTKVQVRHVANAIAALLADKQPQLTETIAIGCRIRMERPRRKPRN